MVHSTPSVPAPDRRIIGTLLNALENLVQDSALIKRPSGNASRSQLACGVRRPSKTGMSKRFSFSNDMSISYSSSSTSSPRGAGSLVNMDVDEDDAHPSTSNHALKRRRDNGPSGSPIFRQFKCLRLSSVPTHGPEDQSNTNTANQMCTDSDLNRNPLTRPGRRVSNPKSLHSTMLITNYIKNSMLITIH